MWASGCVFCNIINNDPRNEVIVSSLWHDCVLAIDAGSPIAGDYLVLSPWHRAEFSWFSMLALRRIKRKLAARGVVIDNTSINHTADGGVRIDGHAHAHLVCRKEVAAAHPGVPNLGLVGLMRHISDAAHH